MTKHTHSPLPWKFLKRDDRFTIATSYYNPDYEYETYSEENENIIAGIWATGDIDEANAAHIVKCVNYHEKLVEMVRGLRDALSAACGDINSLAQYGGSTAEDDAKGYTQYFVEAHLLLKEIEGGADEIRRP